jgi:hypothetical protein
MELFDLAIRLNWTEKELLYEAAQLCARLPEAGFNSEFCSGKALDKFEGFC